jgi:sugar lactone lactonase YvrE
VGT